MSNAKEYLHCAPADDLYLAARLLLNDGCLIKVIELIEFGLECDPDCARLKKLKYEAIQLNTEPNAIPL